MVIREKAVIIPYTILLRMVYSVVLNYIGLRKNSYCHFFIYKSILLSIPIQAHRRETYPLFSILRLAHRFDFYLGKLS